MGREIRKVPGDWKHPKDKNGIFIPLFEESYDDVATQWVKEFLLWIFEHDSSKEGYFWEWAGMPPDPTEHMPNWPSEKRTHFQFYENTSEGTPCSPPIDNMEELSEWVRVNLNENL